MRIPKTFTQIGTGLALTLMLFCSNVLAQEARYFRVTGPVATAITHLAPDGMVTWTNVPTNATFTVQTTSDLVATNWVTWVQVPATEPTTIHRIFDPNPPVGMAFIPAGSFVMGATTNIGHESISDAVPQHSVYVSAFYIDKFEVTKALWDEVKAWAVAHGYSFDYADSGQGKAGNHPAHSMTWYDMVKWCNARSEKEGGTPAYFTSAAQTTVYRAGQVDVLNDWVKWNSSGYRLPTEAEWEKTARGGVSGRRFPWGNTITHGHANYRSLWSSGAPYFSYDVNPTENYHPSYNDDVYPYTSPVGTFAPNGYGLYDMVGNVSERCWDWYGFYSLSPRSDPRGSTSGEYRVDRGGSWGASALSCQTAYRYYFNPASKGIYFGFRCVRAVGQ